MVVLQFEMISCTIPSLLSPHSVMLVVIQVVSIWLTMRYYNARVVRVSMLLMIIEQ